MAEAATQDTGATKPARMSRDEAMAQIGNKRAEELNQELDKDNQIEITAASAENDDEDAEDRAADAERKRLERAAAKAERAERTETEGDKTTIYDFLDEPDLAKTKVRVKVDGHDEEVVLADALKDVQKLRAASKRLEEAALVKREADELKAAAVAEAAEIRRVAKEEAAAGKKETPSGPDGFREATSFMYEGDQDKAAEAMHKAVNDEIERRVKGGGGATANISEITAQVRLQVAWDTAIEQFSVDHPDIASDPRAMKLWQEDLNVAGPDSRTPGEAVRRATEKFLEWRDGARPGGDKVTTEDGALQERAAEKRRAAERSVRSSTSLASGTRPRESAPLTASQIIAQMKGARGQTT